MRRTSLAPLAFGVVLAALAAYPADAHKAITSPYTFNEHVFPILRDRCVSCHFDGGPTPMSLATFRDTLPWAETIREHLMARKMPPWYVDPLGPAVKGAHAISTREIDTIITWSVGGTPEGVAAKAQPAPAPPPLQWTAGEPDLKIPMPAEHAVPSGTLEETFEFTVPTGLNAVRWVRAVDLLPGNRAIVRGAVIAIENGPVLAAWAPGDDAALAPGDIAFKLEPGAVLSVRMHYKKHWRDEYNAVADRSTVGLYVTGEPPRGGLTSRTYAGPAGGNDSPSPRVFGGEVGGAVRVYGILPSTDRVYASLEVSAVLADGQRISLLKLRQAQPEWYRRYWLAAPVDVPNGARIEVTAVPAPPDPFGIPVRRRYPLQVGVEYVPQGSGG